MDTRTNTTLTEVLLREIGEGLEREHAAFRARYPGPSGERQPIHTYYCAGDLFRRDLVRTLGDLALLSLDEFAPDFITFAKAIGLPGSDRLPDASSAGKLAQTIESDLEFARTESRAAWFAYTIYTRARDRLLRVPVEDLRIDFEDGYGNRLWEDEDRHAAAAACEITAAIEAGALPGGIGIRIKPFSEDLRARSLRTLDIVVTELAAKARGKFPAKFFVNLAKVTVPGEVAALAKACAHLERLLALAPGTLRIELMIETTQGVINERGEANLLPLVDAARGRCVAVHFGVYDYTAARGITAAHQRMLHPACDFAREVMQVALAGTGVWLSDGGTNVLPVPVYRADGPSALTAQQIAENRAAVHAAWRRHFEDVRHSLVNGFYQGWDLHPAQLPTRYAAVYSFFLESLEAAAARLRALIEKGSEPSGGDVADDAATGQGLLGYVLRAVDCGAIGEREAESLTGLATAEIRGGSFAGILAARRE
jgi:citrate lyase beta subunit